MARMTSFKAEDEMKKFVAEAANFFSLYPEKRTYGSIDGRDYRKNDVGESARWLALKWGADDDCVLVLQLDEWWEPVIYQQVIPEHKDTTNANEPNSQPTGGD